MQLSGRAYVLIALAAVAGVASLWVNIPWLSGLWRLPLLALLAGLAWEGWQLSRVHIEARLQTHQPAFLGRPQPAAFALRASRPVCIEYLPLLPPQCAPLAGARRLTLTTGEERDGFALAPVRLGSEACPALRARMAGLLGLAWWPRRLPVPGTLRVVPGTPQLARAPARGSRGGARARRAPGAGEQLHQLRRYQRGDPLSRIDWKATARTGTLISREGSAQPRLDLLLALDAGSSSQASIGTPVVGVALERYSLYAGLAARLAHSTIASGDRMGLMLFAGSPLAAVAPDRGWSTLARVRRQLTETRPQPIPADPVAAAMAMRRLLRQRTLVLVLTDLEDATDALAQLPRVLGRPHCLIIAGAQEPRLTELASAEARAPDDPWIALAAQEHLARSAALQRRLRQQGCRVVVAPPGRLEQAVLAEQASLRAHLTA
jgi:uncharacterized protein (DUF58 family)